MSTGGVGGGHFDTVDDSFDARTIADGDSDEMIPTTGHLWWDPEAILPEVPRHCDVMDQESRDIAASYLLRKEFYFIALFEASVMTSLTAESGIT